MAFLLDQLEIMKNTLKTAKIMIVEDERVVAMALEDTLISLGHSVCGLVSSGDQALKIASSSLPDLVMMDIKIKGSIDGIETAKRLKDHYGIPVIFLTAYADQEILERAKLTEPLGYILKPFKSLELRSVVEVAIYKAEMEKKLQKINQDLESKVKHRTQKLTDEITWRKMAEKKLQQKTDYLRQANKALKSMLESREAEKRAVEEELLLNIKKYASPYIELIEQQHPDREILMAVDMLKKTLNELISPASKTLFAKFIDLTPQEVKIADLIRHGKTTKDIAKLLNIAPSSVSTYRNHIRRKMGLLNSSTNLETYLNSFRA